jgi:hypothetical protein
MSGFKNNKMQIQYKNAEASCMNRNQLRFILKDKYDEYTNLVITQLEELDANSMLSGDDSSSENVWEEFALQIQIEHSIFFELYEEIIHQFISDSIKSINLLDLQLLWLDTDEYFEVDDDGFPNQCDMLEAVKSKIYSEIVIRADNENLYL